MRERSGYLKLLRYYFCVDIFLCELLDAATRISYGICDGNQPRPAVSNIGARRGSERRGLLAENGFKGKPARLHQNRRKIAGAMEDSDDLERLLFGIVDDQIFRIRMHNPKAEGQRGQIFPHTTSEWGSANNVAGPKDRFFNPVRRFRVV